MKRLLMSALLAFGLAWCGEEAKLPLPFAAGTIVSFAKETTAQRFLDMAAVAKAEDARSGAAENELVKTEEAGYGMMFAVFTVQVEAKRSLSAADYQLVDDRGRVQPCLGMARNDADFYDYRLKAQEGPDKFRLIFRCAEDAYEVRLRSAFPQLPLPEAGDFVITSRPAAAN